MATKKLKAELEVDTSKAKQKVAREFAETGGSGAGGDVSDAAGKAAKNLQELSNGAKEANVNMKSAIKAFAGMGIGLAASYAQAQMEPGSVGARAVGYLGAAASGAVMGAVAGPWGAVAGGAVGIAKEGFSQAAQDKAAEKAKEEALRSIETWERARAQTLAFKELLEGLTKTETDASERLARINEELQKREDFEANVAQTQRDAIKNGRDDILAEATEKRQRNAAEMDALNALLKQMPSSGGGGGGASWNGVDALSSVGGMFAGGGAGARALDDIAASTAETVKVLKEIERNTDNGGGATWQ